MHCVDYSGAFACLLFLITTEMESLVMKIFVKCPTMSHAFWFRNLLRLLAKPAKQIFLFFSGLFILLDYVVALLVCISTARHSKTSRDGILQNDWSYTQASRVPIQRVPTTKLTSFHPRLSQKEKDLDFTLTLTKQTRKPWISLLGKGSLHIGISPSCTGRSKAWNCIEFI